MYWSNKNEFYTYFGFVLTTQQYVSIDSGDRHVIDSYVRVADGLMFSHNANASVAQRRYVLSRVRAVQISGQLTFLIPK